MENKHEKYQRLIDYCRTLPPLPTAVVHPCDASSLAGAIEAAQMGLIAPILCSRCFVMAVPGHETPLIITDAALNIAPPLEEERDILQNAIDLAHAMLFQVSWTPASTSWLEEGGRLPWPGS